MFKPLKESCQEGTKKSTEESSYTQVPDLNINEFEKVSWALLMILFQYYNMKPLKVVRTVS